MTSEIEDARAIIRNPELFGNDAAEDEQPEVLSSYFVEKPEFANFRNPERPLSIVRSRKGFGKSALLVNTRHELLGQDVYSASIDSSYLHSLFDKVKDSITYAAWSHQWQCAIASVISHTIAKELSFAFSDDKVTLVEAAELAGFKGKNFLSSIVDRLKLKAVPIERERLENPNPMEVLKRVRDGEAKKIWLFIDDIDATFVPHPDNNRKLATFFTACRTLAREVNGLCIRVSVRGDVWSLIKRTDESLDKVEQYCFDITWHEAETRQLLSRRIQSFLERENRASPITKSDQTKTSDWKERLMIQQAFERYMIWNSNERPPHVVVHTLSYSRPRWGMQLCRMAAKAAVASRRNRIAIKDINSVSRDYSRSRLADLVREHHHQCPQLEEVLTAFVGAEPKFTITDLLSRVSKNVGDHLPDVKIDGKKAEAREIAHFLYRIGYLSGRQESNGTYEHIFFEQRPDLIASRALSEKGLQFEIHPCFRETP